MASTCISNCVKDAAAVRVPVRATYVNLYKWPESDVEFIRSLSSNDHNKRRNINGSSAAAVYGHPKVVDSISCRQLYLRSYTFSRADDGDGDGDDDDQSSSIDDRTAKKNSRTRRRRRRRKSRSSSSSSRDRDGGRRKCTRGFRRVKTASCAALAAIFRRLLYCTTKIDVVS
ncbi:hypothetical protein M9H77_15971 [Catharanthus roseus]|uniref:Uncharacterized protein n=1 Tax=Catharanthus roseus TaxID=4058 RepID=A0ACC0AYM7_CATRO|nr:hypothetical protein M9H77_15971 [Catharanthus roseus]